ncbi:MAG: hypothetical protein EP346_07510 [Bacteroidetes bacterium]|nr:MAG: hypothetical protein EP346_07510 [Bacteroidota bacterium]
MKKALVVWLFVSMIALFVYYSTSDYYNRPLLSSPNTAAQTALDTGPINSEIYFPNHPRLQAMIDTIQKTPMELRMTASSSKSALFHHTTVVKSDSTGQPTHVFVPPFSLDQLSHDKSLTEEEREIVLDKISELKASFQNKLLRREGLGHHEYFPEHPKLQAIADSIDLYSFRMMATSKSIYIHDAEPSSSSTVSFGGESTFVIPSDLKTMLEMDNLTKSDRAIIEKVVAELRMQHQERNE